MKIPRVLEKGPEKVRRGFGQGIYRVFVGALQGEFPPAPLKTPYNPPANTLAGYCPASAMSCR